MANAKQCDRCGGFYVMAQAADPLVECSASLAALTAALCPSLNKPDFQSIIEKHIDLCPACSTSLKKWLNQKEKDNG